MKFTGSIKKKSKKKQKKSNNNTTSSAKFEKNVVVFVWQCYNTIVVTTHRLLYVDDHLFGNVIR